MPNRMPFPDPMRLTMRLSTVLGNIASEPVRHELKSLIHDLNGDEQIELVAQAWPGRGDGAIAERGSLQASARDAHNARTARYLLGLPMLSDYLEEGLSLFGETCAEFDAE